MRAPLCGAVALSFLVPAASAGNVLLVDSTGAGDFTDVQAAVDAALEGDTIVVRRPPEDDVTHPPPYGSVVIDGKSLALVNVRDGELQIGAVEVRGLGAGQSVVLSGLTLRPVGSAGADESGLSVRSCDGAVRVQDCVVWGGPQHFFPVGRPGIAARDTADLVVSRSTIHGGAGAWRFDVGGPALVTTASRIVLLDSTVEGGGGGSETAFAGDAYGGPGGTGIEAHASFVHISGGAVIGGYGGYAMYGDPSEGGDGGTGIEASADSAVYLLDVGVRGGPAGHGDTLDGDPGPDIVGSVTIVPATARGLAAPDRIQEDASIPLVFEGEPGETVVLLRSEASRSRLVDPVTGVVLVAPPFERHVLGTVPAGGTLEFDLPAPDAPAGGSLELVLQAAFVDAGGATRLGPAGHVFVMDEAAPPICGRRFFVDADAPPGGDGSSWANAFRDPHEALVRSVDCPEHPTEIWIAEGSYRPEGPGGDPERAFRVWPSTLVYGGFAGHETALDQRDVAAHPTVLDGDLNGDDAPGVANRTDNAHEVVRVGSFQTPATGIRLDGLVVRGAYAGAGLHVIGSASLVRCTFADNWGYGVDFGSITGNENRLDADACRFLANYGNGLHAFGHSSIPGRVRITNSVFAANHVSFLGTGAAMRLLGACELELSNSVVAANYALLGVAGVEGSEDADATIANCIFWANRSNPSSPHSLQERSLLVPRGSVDHCCIEGLDGSLGGLGNHRFDPRFVDLAGADGIVGTLDDDLRLGPGSPCIDAGTNALVPADVLDLDGDGDTTEPLPFDLDGAPRFQDDPNAPDVGAGTPPIVDMGAFERAP